MRLIVPPREAVQMLLHPQRQLRIVHPVYGARGRALVEERRLAKSECWDMAGLRDEQAPWPHMLAQPYALVDYLAEKRLKSWEHIVICGGPDIIAAARLFWVLKLMGKDTPFINAHIDELARAGAQVAAGPPDDPSPPRERNTGLFRFFLRMRYLVDFGEMEILVRRNLIEQQHSCIIDTRAPEQFAGEDGQSHIPTSRNLPFRDLLTPSGLLRPLEELHAVIAPFRVQDHKRVVATCNTGSSAALLFLALCALGHKNVSLYDGSWREYPARRAKA